MNTAGIFLFFIAACRGKKSPLPGMVTKKPYHTLVGDPDISWYLGLDPEVKPEDVDPPADSKVSTVEVSTIFLSMGTWYHSYLIVD